MIAEPDFLDPAQGFLAVDWVVRRWLPTWLDLSYTTRVHADTIRCLDPLTTESITRRADLPVRVAEDEALWGGVESWEKIKTGDDAEWRGVRTRAWVLAGTALDGSGFSLAWPGVAAVREVDLALRSKCTAWAAAWTVLAIDPGMRLGVTATKTHHAAVALLSRIVNYEPA